MAESVARVDELEAEGSKLKIQLADVTEKHASLQRETVKVPFSPVLFFFFFFFFFFFLCSYSLFSLISHIMFNCVAFTVLSN